ncbi:MAG: M56 family metallopeptidase [Kaistella sp.]
MDDNAAPFSFCKTIYLDKDDYNDGQIDERIFLHEKCHVKEKHSLDILFLEVLRIFTWFNPALFFYKRAILSNHEFLADDFVLQNDFDLQSYQHLILEKIEYSEGVRLTHQLNFNSTKKRFIMMTTKTSKLIWAKKIALLPVAAVLFVFLSKEVQAQQQPQKSALTPEATSTKYFSTKRTLIPTPPNQRETCRFEKEMQIIPQRRTRCAKTLKMVIRPHHLLSKLRKIFLSFRKVSMNIEN